MKVMNYLLALPFAALAALIGCAGVPNTQFFVLAPPPDTRSETQSELSIQPVHLPSYLQQPGIAMSVTPHQVLHAQYHRWAEPLEEGMQRLLRTELERGFDHQPIQGVVTLNVRHFHGDANGRVLLDADWKIEGSTFARSGRYFAQVQQQANGFAALVAAQAVLVEQLADEMITALEPDLLALATDQ